MDEKDENSNVTRASIRCDKNNKENTAGDGEKSASERARKINGNSCPSPHNIDGHWTGNIRAKKSKNFE